MPLPALCSEKEILYDTKNHKSIESDPIDLRGQLGNWLFYLDIDRPGVRGTIMFMRGMRYILHICGVRGKTFMWGTRLR